MAEISARGARSLWANVFILADGSALSVVTLRVGLCIDLLNVERPGADSRLEENGTTTLRRQGYW